MDLLARVLETKFTYITKFYEELTSVTEANGLQISTIRDELNFIKSYLKCSDQFKSKLMETDQAFYVKFEPFIETLSQEYGELDNSYQKFLMQFSESCNIYGEDSNKMKPQEFLEPIQAFLKNYEQALVTHQRRLEREARQQTKKKASLSNKSLLFQF